jgi:hypothetical protein
MDELKKVIEEVKTWEANFEFITSFCALLYIDSILLIDNNKHALMNFPTKSKSQHYHFCTYNYPFRGKSVS